MKMIRVQFESRGIRLAGIYHPSEGGSSAVAVISHGFAANKDSEKWIYVCDGLADAGINSLRFDYAGCGDSGGLFEDVTLTGRIADLRAAVSFIRGEYGANRRVALIGSSFGGDSALYVASDPGIVCTAVIATPFTFDFVSETEIGADGEYIELDGMRVKRGLLDDVAKYDVAKQVEKVSRLLVIHGTMDQVVPPSDARIIYDYAAEPKRLEMIQDADHRFSLQLHRDMMFDLILAWFRQNIFE
jgi:uncharacterized protein